MKICVYAIAKDEAKFASRWYNSMGEADYVCVLDTGSTDDTVEILRSLGAKVETQTFEPFDFAAARNAAMALCPEDADILVCTDIDEVFSIGWAKKVRAAFEAVPAANCGACKFITKFKEDGTPQDTMHYWKIHRRDCGAKWVARVHEYLEIPNKFEVYIDDIFLSHHPDPEKSRAQYIDLLKIEADEKHDPRSLHYYGRELMFRKRYLEAIFQFERYISHPDAKWKDERAWTMRFMGRCYGWLGDYDRAIAWFLRSMVETDWQREAAVDLADLAQTRGDFGLVVFACRFALARTDRHTHYFTEEDAWGYKPHDLLAVALFRIGKFKEATTQARMAWEICPNDERLKKNLASMERTLKEVEKK